MLTEKNAIAGYKAQVEQYGTPISSDEFRELRDYANRHGIKLSGFKDFVGDISAIKTVIDDICVISNDFPEILNERQGIWLELDYNLGTDFATTESGHIIHLNAVFYSNMEMLTREYSKCESDGRFVKGTDWRAIVRHEVGHVVANVYNIDPMDLAKELKETKRTAEILDILTDELSVYSTEYNDGREIISECFSGYYSNVGNTFADMYVKACIDRSKKAGDPNEIME